MLTFAPDADPIAPGVLTSVTNMMPTERGYAGFPSAVASSYSALASAVRSAALLSKLDGTTRFFAGTGSKLYEGVGGAWSDVTRGTGDYNAGSEAAWSFAQFGNSTLAAQKGDKIQRSTSGAFADISSAPQASIIFTVGEQVMALDVTDATRGNRPDGWWCSAYSDETDWTPDVSTQCFTAQLVDVPGPLVGGRSLGSMAVAYKARGIFVGNYVGGDVGWQWDRIPGAVGTVSNESIVSVDNAHFFVGNEDIWAFDGSRPVPISDGVRDWFFSRLSKAYAYKIKGMHDRTNSRVMWFYPSNGSSAIDAILIYDYKANRFGHADLTVECPVEIATDPQTIDGLSSLSSTIDGLPDIPFDSPFWISSQPVLAYFNTSHTLQLLSGASAGSSLVTGNTGDDEQYTSVTKVVPRFTQRPTSATMTHQYADTSGDSWSNASSSALTNNRFDAMWSSRWHRFGMSFTGDVEITDYKVSFSPDGQE